jgi:hypothetical protein
MSWTSRSALVLCLAWGALGTQPARAQEAGSGFDVRATMTAQAVASKELTEAPRAGAPVTVGARAVVYPTWKINENWFATGALQVVTRPYYFEDFSTAGFGAKGAVLQSTLNYSRVWNSGSIFARAGVMSTAFGSFLLRYDDADNALVDLPMGYGYYYSEVSILGVAGAQIDATKGRWDGRAQFANSSPANPRSVFAHDQYGNWAGGGGYTIRQGFRVGASAYRGPYLSRRYAFFYPGEANPNTLSAHALGLDASWARGHTSAQGELQKFVMPYTKIPAFREKVGYVELKQVLSPRWYVAVRSDFSSTSLSGDTQSVETAAGFRPNRLQVLKIEYEYIHYNSGSDRNESTVAIQLATTLHRAFSRN